MHKKSALFCEKRSQFRIPTLQTLSKPPFLGPFRGFPQGFWQESGRNALSGAGRGQENEGEGRGLLYIIIGRRGRERRKGHGRGQQKSQTGAPNRRLRERRPWEGRLRMTILRGQSEDFEGALWPHLGAKMITWKAEALQMGHETGNMKAESCWTICATEWAARKTEALFYSLFQQTMRNASIKKCIFARK